MQHTTGRPVRIVLAEAEYPGVKKVAHKLADDFARVSGTRAQVVVVPDAAGAAMTDPSGDPNGAKLPTIIVSTLGHTALVSSDDISATLRDRHQAFQLKFIADNTLAVVGTDLLGTEYGLYAISEYIGVSPMHFWGDVAPEHRESIEIGKDIAQISRTPSVKYRGFFINDEWPGFGTWTFHHFGGFTAEVYDHIFDLLLRLRGNYLWPAMWTSSFALDGPGDANEVLADEYGITIGASHHEPLLRASEEWAKVKGPGTPYGTEWNYLTNKEGLLNYWRDAMKRSGHLNKMITLGIRGEHDSELLGPEASLQANIDLLKDAITEQRKIIDAEGKKPDNPLMLALYKEVEEFYYGSESAKGLQGWEGLDDVTLMFCEDNFGFMRSLPETDKERANSGMYYHLDYHGGPVSYEWMPSTSFERIHDQMSLAYDYGIREVWVVNVGDLKFNEVPLAFFLAMAYDMDKYGNHNRNAAAEYTKQWLAKTFPAVPSDVRAKIGQVLHGYIRLNAMRRPEALNGSVYHGAHHQEADRMLERAEQLQNLDREVSAQLTGNALTAYQSLIGIPARASTNLLQMMVAQAKNIHYAKQGKPVANDYAELVSAAIMRDKAIEKEIRDFQDGKWFGHEKEAHIGFTTWNDDGNILPSRTLVEPVGEPRIIVSRADQEHRFHKTYGGGKEINLEGLQVAYVSSDPVIVDDFLFAGCDSVTLEIANDGTDKFDFTIAGLQQVPWLTVDRESGTVSEQQNVVLKVDRTKLPADATPGNPVSATLAISGGGTSIPILVFAQREPTEPLPSGTYLPGPDYVTAIPANGFAASRDVDGAEFNVVPLGGRNGDAIRVFPTTASYPDDLSAHRPTVTYRALITKAGEYTIQVWQVPTGVVVRGRPLRFVLGVDNRSHLLTAISADVNAGYHGEPRWADPALSNIRVASISMPLDVGVHEISIGAVDPNLMIERIVLHLTNSPPPPSYLGPPDSVRR